MMMDSVVTLGGRRFYFRLSVKTLHLIEQALGTGLDNIRTSMSLDHCLVIARYALRHPDSGQMLTEEEFDALIDSIDISELNNMFPQQGQSGEQGKN